MWSTIYKDFPKDPVSGGVLVDHAKWKYEGGEVYATVDDQRSVPQGTADTWIARLRFTLHHDPKPK